MTDPEVIVIGAGAAGLGAARHLARAGIAARVVEARGRIGGRAFTSYDPTGLPIELGCAWLHSADENELAAIAAGLTALQRAFRQAEERGPQEQPTRGCPGGVPSC